jgi:hypothetical protein
MIGELFALYRISNSIFKMKFMISRYEVPQMINGALKQKIRGLHPYSHCLDIELSLDLYTSVNDLTAIAKSILFNLSEAGDGEHLDIF